MNFKQYLKSKQMSMYSLAKAMDVQYVTVFRWSKSTIPNTSSRHHMATILGVRVKEINKLFP